MKEEKKGLSLFLLFLSAISQCVFEDKYHVRASNFHFHTSNSLLKLWKKVKLVICRIFFSKDNCLKKGLQNCSNFSLCTKGMQFYCSSLALIDSNSLLQCFSIFWALSPSWFCIKWGGGDWILFHISQHKLWNFWIIANSINWHLVYIWYVKWFWDSVSNPKLA